MADSSSTSESRSNMEPTVSSEVKFEGKILKLRVDKVRMADGLIATREIVEHCESICAVPIDGQGNVLMVKQYRKPAEAELLEIVAPVSE